MSATIKTIPKNISDSFPRRVRDAIDDGLRCEPADRPRAEAGLRRVYRAAGLASDVPIVWVPSPLVGALAAPIAATIIAAVAAARAVDSAVWSAVRSAVGSAVDSAVGSAVYSAVRSAVDSAVRSAVGSAVGSAVDSGVRSAVGPAVDSAVFWHGRRGGQFWIAWPAFVEVIEAIGVDHPSFDAIRAEADVCRSAGWYWPNKKFIMVCERPHSIRRDGDGRLHCPDGPAVDYGDTFRLYAWRGTTIPARWVEDRACLTPDLALTAINVEQRRAACEMLGWQRILAELSARVIDDSGDLEIGQLVEVDLPGAGRERFLRVMCGTKREFALAVPPDMKTARQAQAWGWGMTEFEFEKPEVRT